MGEPIRYIAILGGPGSGKRSVGASLARRLDWTFVDFDAEIARHEGRPVPHLLDDLSEDSVESLTRELVRDSVAPRATVVAFDGRWPGNSVALDQFGSQALVTWLSASPSEAVRRMKASPRPQRLLRSPDPVEAVANVVRQRASIRNRADLKLPTDGLTVENVAFLIEQLARGRGC